MGGGEAGEDEINESSFCHYGSFTGWWCERSLGWLKTDLGLARSSAVIVKGG